MNLVIFNAEGFLMNSHQMKVLQNSYHPQKFCQVLSIHCSALDLTNSPQGVSRPISVAMPFRLVSSLLLMWSLQMNSRCWPHERQIEPLWFFVRFLLMVELNSAENQFFSSGISDGYLHNSLFLCVCLPSAHRKLSLSTVNSKNFSCNSQWEARILCGMTFCSPTSTVKLIIYKIEGKPGNRLEWLWLGPSQSPGLSSVSVCRPLLLCLSIVSGFMLRINSWIKSIAIGKSGEAKRLVYWGLCLHVLHLSNQGQIALGCINSSKSNSSRELIPLTDVKMISHLSYLTAPNRTVPIDLAQSIRVEEKEQIASSSGIDTFSC
jgi:hypothetical protein